MIHYDFKSIFDHSEVINYCEKHGIYEVYKRNGNVITYYSYFGGEGMYKVTKNVLTGAESRKHLSDKTMKQIMSTNRYNYFCG